MRRTIVAAILATAVALAPTAVAEERFNPGRGQYSWSASPGDTLTGNDRYLMVDWSTLEPERGQWDFSTIDQALAEAEAAGGGFNLRVTPLDTEVFAISLPTDVATHQTTWEYVDQQGWVHHVPDWNSAYYQQRWAELMRALGAKYNGDPRLSSVDVSGYGNWGEGHDSPYNQQLHTERAPATRTSVERIHQATFDAFPDTRVLWNTSTIVYDSRGWAKFDETAELLLAALRAHPTMGLRNDCLGDLEQQDWARTVFETAISLADERGTPHQYHPEHRWKTAPVVAEWCATPDFTLGAQQVRDQHISQLNHPHTVAQLSASDRAAWEDAVTASGYSYSASLVGGAVRWVNDGVAPTYRDWDVSYRIEPGGNIVDSPLELQGMLPGKQVDRVAWPNLAPGLYDVFAEVTDPTGYYAPMSLDGGNMIGTLTVGDGTTEVVVGPPAGELIGPDNPDDPDNDDIVEFGTSEPTPSELGRDAVKTAEAGSVSSSGQSGSSGDGLGTIGIVIGVLAALAVALGAGWFYFMR